MTTQNTVQGALDIPTPGSAPVPPPFSASATPPPFPGSAMQQPFAPSFPAPPTQHAEAPQFAMPSGPKPPEFTATPVLGAPSFNTADAPLPAPRKPLSLRKLVIPGIVGALIAVGGLYALKSSQSSAVARSQPAALVGATPIDPSGAASADAPQEPIDPPTTQAPKIAMDDLIGGKGETISKEGNGNTVFPITNPSGGTHPFLVRVDYDAPTEFGRISVEALGADGTGTGNAFGYNKAHGTYLFGAYGSEAVTQLKVEADGPWKLSVIPLASAKTWDGTSPISGNGPEVLLIPTPLAKATNVTLDKQQLEVDFSGFDFLTPNSWGETGLSSEGSGSTGQSVMPKSTTVVEVTAEGTWTITPTA